MAPGPHGGSARVWRAGCGAIFRASEWRSVKQLTWRQSLWCGIGQYETIWLIGDAIQAGKKVLRYGGTTLRYLLCTSPSPSYIVHTALHRFRSPGKPAEYRTTELHASVPVFAINRGSSFYSVHRLKRIWASLCRNKLRYYVQLPPLGFRDARQYLGR